MIASELIKVTKQAIERENYPGFHLEPVFKFLYNVANSGSSYYDFNSDYVVQESGFGDARGFTNLIVKYQDYLISLGYKINVEVIDHNHMFRPNTVKIHISWG